MNVGFPGESHGDDLAALAHARQTYKPHEKTCCAQTVIFCPMFVFEMVANDGANPLKYCSCTMYQKDNLCPGFVLKMFDHVNKLQCWSFFGM